MKGFAYRFQMGRRETVEVCSWGRAGSSDAYSDVNENGRKKKPFIYSDLLILEEI